MPTVRRQGDGGSEKEKRIECERVAMQQKKWTQSDYKQLEEMWAVYPVSQIAKALGRTETTIKRMACEQSLGPRLLCADVISLSCLFTEILGRPPKRSYLSKKLKDKNFPAKEFVPFKRTLWVIGIDEFWQWCERNKGVIDLSLLEKNVFGKEPDWVDDQRKIDAENRPFKPRRWTRAEKARLKLMLEMGAFSLTQICEALQRTNYAVRRKIYDLGLAFPPPQPYTPWTTKEKQAAISLHEKGLCIDAIAIKLNRTAPAVDDIIRIARAQSGLGAPCDDSTNDIG